MKFSSIHRLNEVHARLSQLLSIYNHKLFMLKRKKCTAPWVLDISKTQYSKTSLIVADKMTVLPMDPTDESEYGRVF